MATRTGPDLADRLRAAAEAGADPGRVQRGRSYTGRVVEMALGAGWVDSLVTGQRDDYFVEVTIPTPSGAAWNAIIADVARDAIAVRELMAGEVPERLVAAFARAGASLVPTRASGMEAACDCPDAPVFCKHAIALVHVLADDLRERPLRLLDWHGMRSVEFVADVCASAGLVAVPPARSFGVPAAGVSSARFWIAADVPIVRDASRPPTSPDRILQEVGPLAVTVDETPLTELMRPTYERLAIGARAILEEW